MHCTLTYVMNKATSRFYTSFFQCFNAVKFHNKCKRQINKKTYFSNPYRNADYTEVHH